MKPNGYPFGFFYAVFFRSIKRGIAGALLAAGNPFLMLRPNQAGLHHRLITLRSSEPTSLRSSSFIAQRYTHSAYTAA